ncbi:hypothetical protein, partial [Enterococcus faecium]
TTEAPQPAAQASIEGRDIGEQWNEMSPVRRRELMARPGSPFTDAASDSTTSPSEQVESKQADEYAARLRELASGFPGTYRGRPMAPLASDI